MTTTELLVTQWFVVRKDQGEVQYPRNGVCRQSTVNLLMSCHACWPLSALDREVKLWSPVLKSLPTWRDTRKVTPILLRMPMAFWCLIYVIIDQVIYNGKALRTVTINDATLSITQADLIHADRDALLWTNCKIKPW